MRSFRIGVDVGGTFTDLLALEQQSGAVTTVKVPSTPSDPSLSIMSALEAFLAEVSATPEQVSFFAHGTTVATNALLELRGAPTGLLVTEGFRGIYETRDQSRPAGQTIFDARFQKPPMLVSQAHTEEVRERIGFDGGVITALDEQEVRHSVRRLREQGVQSLAVCLLFSFQNPAHERRVRQIIAEEWPEVWVSVSSDLLPQIREYPRLSTTVLDAYVGPVVHTYLRALRGRMRQRDFHTNQLYIMQSNGGLVSFASDVLDPSRTLLSGPAAGVIAGCYVGAGHREENLVTLDMGGTSADIGVIRGGAPTETGEGEIAGQTIALPMVEMHTICAGGGTVAWVGPDGLLKVGPHSAGAAPGPACYGKGGTAPTVTDANLVLGYLSSRGLLGGRLPLNRDLAAAAIRDHIAQPLGLDLLTAAAGIVRINNVQMEVAIRLALIQKGCDARNFTLVAFGGAGPVHAGELARHLGIPRVLVPHWPGVTSAMGLLVTDVRHDYLRSRLCPLSTLRSEDLDAGLAALEGQALSELGEEGFHPDQIQLERLLDLRYSGEGYHLTVPLPPGQALVPMDAVVAAFHQRHLQMYGSSAERNPVELVNMRVVARVPVPRPDLHARNGSRHAAAPARRRAYFAEGLTADVLVLNRAGLMPGDQLAGPAIIEQSDATTVVYPGQSARVDDWLNLVITTGA